VEETERSEHSGSGTRSEQVRPRVGGWDKPLSAPDGATERENAVVTTPVRRLFGTDGIRGVVGVDYTPAFVADVGAALGKFLQGNGTVLIALDFRTTSPGIARILAGALMMNGLDVTEVGPMPTPCLQFNVKALGARAGLMVTASHNPTEFNGIKFSGPDGLEIPREAEEFLEKTIAERQFPSTVWNRAGTIRTDSQGLDRYARSIRSHVDEAAIRKARPRVVLDCGNGTSALVSPRLLRELGCDLVTLNSNPDGHFPGHPSEPTEENLLDLRRTVVQTGAVLGIAHDGDSDRVAFVDETGHYIPGEEALAIFARHTLADTPKATIVTAVTSTSCVDDVVTSEGGRLVVTRSGSLPVARAILENSARFGGEENGGFYWPEHQVARDGPMSSAKMLELLAVTGSKLSQLTASLPRYYVIKSKIPLPYDVKGDVIGDVRELLERRARRLITIDGVKAFFDDGWLLVRPSGTEPICRIFAESRHPDRARQLVDEGIRMVTERVAARVVGSSQR
jgi:phosphomannomutase/phosphoglucomutase